MLELLYVVVIIGLLAALLLTVFAATRTKSQETVCLSNLRQIGLGIKMYESDFGDLPYKFTNLYPTYVQEKQIFRCPIWEARASSLPVEKQEQIKARFTIYSYEPESARYWNEEVPSESGEPGEFHWTWGKLYQMRGEALPLVTCPFHDPTLLGKPEKIGIGPDGRLQMTRLVLRLNGSVSKATAHQHGNRVSWFDL